jgi:hypothetical protein
MFEIYAYGNVDTLTGVFNAIAAIMGGADYFGLIKTVAITGVLVAAFAGLFTPGRFAGWGWFIGFMLVYNAMFLPKVDVVVVDKLGSQPPVAVGNVPIGVAFFGHYTSRVGDVMTRFFETAFQVIPDTNAQLPAELAYQKNGVMFGNRLIQASRAATIGDPQLRTDLIAYVYNCTVYDLQDGTIDPAAFSQSTDIWSLMGNPNPARFSTWGTPVQVDTCPNVYTQLANRLPPEIASARALLAFQLNPSMDPALAPGVIDGQIEQAYTKTKIAVRGPGRRRPAAPEHHDQPGAGHQQPGRAQAQRPGGDHARHRPRQRHRIHQRILPDDGPHRRRGAAHGAQRDRGGGLRRLPLRLPAVPAGPGSRPGHGHQELRDEPGVDPALATALCHPELRRHAGQRPKSRSGRPHGLGNPGPDAGHRGQHLPGRHLRPGDRRLHGGVDPHHRHRHHQGRRSRLPGGDRHQRHPVGSVERSRRATKGLVTQNAVSIDQQQLAPTRTSAFMASTTDARGTTIQGSGPDAGVFRYQATLSRLASTFTVTERQATAVGESAREAESFATTQREAMQRSQATAMTHALGIQDSYEKSQQRTGATSTSEGGSTNTQFQT